MPPHNFFRQWKDAPWPIQDPGSGNPIPVGDVGAIGFRIAASTAETNTLAAPMAAGRLLMLGAVTVGSGGTRTVTVATGYDVAGATTLVFDTAGDFAILTSFEVAANTYRWRIGPSSPGTVVPADAGAKAGTNVVVVEKCDGILHKTILTCTATPITMADEAGVIQHGGVKLYDFPEGLICTLGAVIDGSITTPVHDHADGGTIATWDGDIALGTVVASNNNTLATTEQDILQSTATTQAVAQVANVDAISIATILTESGARWLDGTSTAKDMYLNLLIDDSANNDAHTALFTGTVSLAWLSLGDK